MLMRSLESQSRSMVQIETIQRPIMFQADHGGCCYYRAKLPCKFTGAFVTDRFSQQTHPETHELLAYTGLGQRSVFQRPNNPNILRAIYHLRTQGFSVGAELDDDIFSISYQNPAHKGWGKDKQRYLGECLKLAEFVTTSTPELAKIIEKRNKNVIVIPNALDQTIVPVPNRDNEILTVGWAGSWSHEVDLQVVRPLFKILIKDKNVRVIFFGYDPMQPENKVEGKHFFQDGIYEFIPWTKDMKEHYENISCLDIAFAPLVDNAFNRSKSNLKWIEHASQKTPVIVSQSPAYSTVQNGKTGFVAKNTADFFKYFNLLAKNRGLRDDIGQAAFEEYEAKYQMTHTAPLWKEVLYGRD